MYTVVLPIPLAAPASTALASDDADPLPSTYRIDSDAADSLYFSGSSLEPVRIQSTDLGSVTVGKSLDTERAEALAQARLAEAERQRQALLLEQKRQEEQRRAEALEQQRKAQLAAAAVPAVSMSYGEVQRIAYEMTVAAFGESQWASMHALIMRESKYDPNAVNRSSGACGIPQALPCSKLSDKSVPGQIAWMINYVRARYGTPSRALQHSYATGWY